MSTASDATGAYSEVRPAVIEVMKVFRRHRLNGTEALLAVADDVVRTLSDVLSSYDETCDQDCECCGMWRSHVLYALDVLDGKRPCSSDDSPASGGAA